jgi:hypothetical protein
MISIIENVFTENRKDAEDEAKKLIRKFPDHPAGYFCMAFLLDNWMATNQTDVKEDDFYSYCDRTIEKGEKLLQNDSLKEWARFFIAGADGFKGTYEARHERWITSFRFGWKGVSVFLEMEAAGSALPDIYYGIGSYNYWRSALTKTLWWMPGIEDKRSEGITMLYKVCQTGIYTGTIASAALIDILLNENMFGDALALAEKQYLLYPKHAAFSWGRAKALFGLKKYDSARAVLHQLLTAMENDQFNNHINEITCRLYLARIYTAEHKNIQAIAECNIIRNFSLEQPIKKRLEPVFGEVKSIEKQAMKEMSEMR